MTSIENKSFFSSGLQSLAQVAVGWLAADNPTIIPLYFAYEFFATNRDKNTLIEIGEYFLGYAANKAMKKESIIPQFTQ